MCAFNGFHIEVEDASFGGGADSGIAGVCERTGLAIAETSDIVFVAAECLLLRGSGRSLVTHVAKDGENLLLELVRAELLVDNLPYYLVGRHCGSSGEPDRS